jgi:hypothetical protein
LIIGFYPASDGDAESFLPSAPPGSGPQEGRFLVVEVNSELLAIARSVDRLPHDIQTIRAERNGSEARGRRVAELVGEINAAFLPTIVLLELQQPAAAALWKDRLCYLDQEARLCAVTADETRLATFMGFCLPFTAGLRQLAESLQPVDDDQQGVSLFDAATFFEAGDDQAARNLVARWHDLKAITAMPIGKCPTDARAKLYRLPEVLADMERVNGLDAKEKEKLRKHLRARLRKPRE